MSGEPLGITEHHQNEIRELLRYNRFKRSERLIGIDLCFKDFVETRLYDDETYTQDEVILCNRPAGVQYIMKNEIKYTIKNV